MNKKVAAFALAIFAAQTVSAEVKVSGFVDMSVFSDDGDASMSLDQFELDVSTDLGEGISMRADVNALGPTAPVELEQAFITYDTGEGLALTVGKFLSCTGFEAAEPTGMYQYSYSATLVYGGYQNGVAASYGSDMFGLYGAVVSSVWDGAETDVSGDESDVGFEAQVALDARGRDDGQSRVGQGRRADLNQRLGHVGDGAVDGRCRGEFDERLG